MRTHIMILVAGGAVCSTAAVAMADDHQTYPRTPVGTVEVKVLPASKAIAATADGSYFESGGGVFMKLFRYIDRNKIAMTVPVEVDVDSNEMRFFVAERDVTKAAEATDDVTPSEFRERTILSVGLRGSYSEKRFNAGVEALRDWIEAQDEWEEAGAPTAVYWHGPYIPGWFKRSEVHLPIARMNR